MLLFDYKIPVEADRALRDAYVALAFAFRRLEGSARSRDTELALAQSAPVKAGG